MHSDAYRKIAGVHSQQFHQGTETGLGVTEMLHEYLLESPGIWAIARIKDVTAGANTYVVDGLNCRDKRAVAAPTCLSVLGARAYSPYAVGSYVLVWFAGHSAPRGLILCAVPLHDNPAFPIPGEILTQGTPSGFAQDPGHTLSFTDDLKAGRSTDPQGKAAFTCNQGTPWDAIPGDWGVINELGVGVGVQKLTAGLRAGCAEVTVSVMDSAVRTVAHRVTEETLTTEYRHFCDQGEGSSVEYMTPYLWEGLGCSTPNTPAYDFQDVTMDTRNVGGDNRARYQPEAWDQVGIFRMVTVTGYLGDLFRAYVTVPAVSEGHVTRDKARNWPGLASVGLSEDGFIAVRTAKGILLEKTCMIPVPEERKEPWDPEGDADAACDYGKATYADDKVDYQWGQAYEPMLRGMHVADHNAFRTGQADPIHILDHEKDWYLPADGDVNILGGGSGAVDISPLGSTFSSAMPDSTTVQVDHRRKVKYYRGVTSVLLSDDGGIHLQDAYGSGMSFSGGNITISARADIILNPGRRVVAMAPHDLILRAKHNVELSSGDGDVRVKAQKQVHVLSGVDGVGGLLLECRAESDVHDYTQQGQDTISSGITLKAEKSPVVAWGDNVYVRGDKKAILDAGSGSGELTLVGDSVRSFARTKFVSAIGVDAGKGTVAGAGSSSSVVTHDLPGLSASVGSTRLLVQSGEVSILGSKKSTASLSVDGGIRASGTVMAPNEHNVPVDPSSESALAAGKKDTVERAINTLVHKDVPNFYERVYSDDQLSWGNDTYRQVTQFSFNTSDQYHTTSFVMGEAPWQTAFRLSGTSDVWDEHVVLFNGVETQPWPGYETWTESAVFGRVRASEQGNVDVATMTGKPQPRTKTSGASPEMVRPNAGYVVDPLA